MKDTAIGKPILIAVAFVALVSVACTISINLPFVEQFQTSATVTDDIRIPRPDSDVTTALTIEFGGGQLNLRPGAIDALVAGTATYNVDELKPEVTATTGGEEAHIATGITNLRSIPNVTKDVKNVWDLNISQDNPINLRIKAGAYEGRLELGGLVLEELYVTDGASKSELSFSEPNRADMGTLRYETGASDIDVSGLANANFARMTFAGGAGEYSLDFSGELQRDAAVDIKAGLGSVIIIVPPGVNAEVNVQGTLSNVNYSGDFTRSGDRYVQSGDGATLTIDVEIGAGNLELRNR